MGINAISRGLLFFFIGASVCSRAQQMPDTNGILSRYPGNNGVLLVKKEHARILEKEGKLMISSVHYEDTFITGNSYDQFGERSIPYSSFIKITDIEARTLVPRGSKYKSFQTTSVNERSEFGGGVFFDDTYYKKIQFPALQKGARTILQYTEEISEPRFFGMFYFNSYIPVIESEFSVDVPEGVNITYRMFNCDSLGITLTKTQKKKSTTYTWKAHGMAAYSSETDAPGIAYSAPHMVVYIKDYNLNGVKATLINGPADLYHWYYSLVKDANSKPDKDLKVFVDSLVMNSASEQEKAKKIFYWVEDNINYIAFEDGLAGFIPREADKTYANRYGDCKDMASLTHILLQSAGIKSYLTWIGTRAIPYTYEEVPLSYTDNHMIVTYILDGKYYFLDATGKYQPFDLPTMAIQGKEALIGKGENDFEIVKIPERKKELNTVRDSTFITLDDSRLSGKGRLVASGYDKIEIVKNLKYVDHEKWKKFFAADFPKGNNKMQLDTIILNGYENKEGMLSVDYAYCVPGYVNQTKTTAYLNMFLDKYAFGDPVVIGERKSDIFIEYKNIRSYVVVLDIPKGWKLDHLPGNTVYSGEKFGFDVSYSSNVNSVYLKYNVYVNALSIGKNDFTDWNDCLKKLKKSYNESIILSKN